MSESRRKHMLLLFDQKETDELVTIWQRRDREKWTDEALDVVREILLDRLGELPPNAPHAGEVEISIENSSIEDAIALEQDDNEPVFYKPAEVLRLVKWMKWGTLIAIAAGMWLSLAVFDAFQNLFQGFFGSDVMGRAWSFVLSIPAVAAQMALTVILIYFPMRALWEVLTILMEMEMRSREN